MDSLITQVIAWPTVLISLLMFGFAPGAVLRMIVLAFRRDDPRRTELLAELPHVPRFERPFWVCEQLEVALFEGLFRRLAELIGLRPASGVMLAPGPGAEPEKALMVDRARCEGHGLCAHLVPELIHLDEHGFPVVMPIPTLPWLEKEATRAVALCPALALRLAADPKKRG